MPPRLLETKAADIKVPEDKEAERKLKEGHEEDDNQDISYFHFGLFWPNMVAYIVVIISLTGAFLSALRVDVIPTKAELQTHFLKFYGQYIFNCSTSYEMPVGGMYSVLNLFDIDMPGNVIFRLVATYPMGIRFFNSIVFRMKASQHKMNSFHTFINDITPALTVVECSTLALFSIITTHTDSDEMHLLMMRLFAISSTTNMLISAAISFSLSSKSNSAIDSLSVVLKMICGVLYCTLIPQIFLDPLRENKPCYALLPADSAIKEYTAIGAYLLYHSTTIIDVRDMKFMCYPRTCSGECEPVDPANFAKGAKYEHCRSWEYNQHHRAALAH